MRSSATGASWSQAGAARATSRAARTSSTPTSAFTSRSRGASGNDVAEVLLADLNDRIRILRVHDFTTDDRIAATIAEHLEILGCVLAGDADAAAAFMRAHVQRSALVVRERVGEALARMFEVAEVEATTRKPRCSSRD